MLAFLLLIFKGYVRLIQEVQLSHSSSDRERDLKLHINNTFYSDRFRCYIKPIRVTMATHYFYANFFVAIYNNVYANEERAVISGSYAMV